MLLICCYQGRPWGLQNTTKCIPPWGDRSADLPKWPHILPMKSQNVCWLSICIRAQTLLSVPWDLALCVRVLTAVLSPWGFLKKHMFFLCLQSLVCIYEAEGYFPVASVSWSWLVPLLNDFYLNLWCAIHFCWDSPDVKSRLKGPLKIL